MSKAVSCLGQQTKGLVSVSDHKVSFTSLVRLSWDHSLAHINAEHKMTRHKVGHAYNFNDSWHVLRSLASVDIISHNETQAKKPVFFL